MEINAEYSNCNKQFILDMRAADISQRRNLGDKVKIRCLQERNILILPLLLNVHLIKSKVSGTKLMKTNNK